MNIFNKKQPEPARLEPTPEKQGVMEQCMEFWLTNQHIIGLFVVIICISVLLIMVGYAAGTGHIRIFSTEANNYEHLTQIVTYYGGELL